jgi:hypothetical protein
VWTSARAALSLAVADEVLSGLPASLQRLCRAATECLSLGGAAVQLMAASSAAPSRRLGEVPFAVGEGPAVDAFSLARPVLVSDLLGEGQSRWPGYVSVVSGQGIGAVYALPLHVGAVRLGVFELYDEHVRRLSSDELSLALVFAETATDCLLDPPAGTAVALLDDPALGAMNQRIEIHQAQGMVTVDLGLDLTAALALMRAHAFSRNLTLFELARAILDGERLPKPDDP